MGSKSSSAVPIFIFLGMLLLFLPCAAIIFTIYRRKRQRRDHQRSRNEATKQLAQTMPDWSSSIEMQPQPHPRPPAPSMPPIRSMQRDKALPEQPMARVSENLPSALQPAPAPGARKQNREQQTQSEPEAAQVRNVAHQQVHLSIVAAPRRQQSQTVSTEHVAFVHEEMLAAQNSGRGWDRSVPGADAGHDVPAQMPKGWV